LMSVLKKAVTEHTSTSHQRRMPVVCSRTI
jgi:hypothetical protein